jgi:putative hemolysin
MFQTAQKAHVAPSRDDSANAVRFSYASPQDSWRRRLVIETIERLTGQPRFKRIYEHWSLDPKPGETIFAAAIRLMRLKIDIAPAALAHIPAEGPVLFVANHPYGVVDGLVLGQLATSARPDTKILTHSLLCQPHAAREVLLPIDFGGTEEALRTTLLTRRRAQDWLKSGHAIAVFPGGGVATSQRPFKGAALDPPWHSFVARLARTPGLRIVPIYFHGQNSRLFHIASHVSYTLRLALLFRETSRRIDSTVRVAIGEPIDACDLEQTGDRRDFMIELRRRTLSLAGQFGSAVDYRKEFAWPPHIRWQ